MKIPFQFAILVGSLSIVTNAAADCGGTNAIVPGGPDMGEWHHPVGRPLPTDGRFNQPNGCVDEVWLFDQNRNLRADSSEVRVFGQQREVACASCHGDSPDQKSAASASVFLRQDASTLCLVCHNL